MTPTPFTIALASTAAAMHFFAPPSQAQSPARRDVLDARFAVPAVVYRSAFADHRPIDDNDKLGWKQANDNVGRIGGWRTYLKEANTPDVPQPAPAASAPARPAMADSADAAPSGRSNRSGQRGDRGHGDHRGHETR